jgi:hypothetical protein
MLSTVHVEVGELWASDDAVEEPLLQADDEVVGYVQDPQLGQPRHQSGVHVHQVVPNNQANNFFFMLTLQNYHNL